MKVRIKFSKLGNVKFIGHLDVMRYFQKLIRRADLPIAYTNGMSPHQIMSFALPLGIGDESVGEYVDIELTESVKTTEAVERLNRVSVEGIQVLDFRQLDDSAKNAMASVWAADYSVSFRNQPPCDFAETFKEFIGRDKIVILKTTKKSEREVDLKPLTFGYEVYSDKLNVRLKCGSVDNIKPELLMEAYMQYRSLPFNELDYQVTRIDLLTLSDDELVSLNEIGEEIL